MIKRFCISILASIILLTTIYECTYVVNATELSESVLEKDDIVEEHQQDEEEDLIDELADENVLNAIWDSLFLYASNYVGNDEITNDCQVDLLADEDANEVIFHAKRDQDELKIILNSELENCEIVYISGNDADQIMIRTMQNIGDISDVIEFTNDFEIDEIDFLKYVELANELIEQNLLSWRNILLENEMSFEDLGFVYWEELCNNTDCVDFVEDKETLVDDTPIEDADESEVIDIIDDNETIVDEIDMELGEVKEDDEFEETELASEEITDDELIGDELEFDSEIYDDEMASEDIDFEEKLDTVVDSPKVERIEAVQEKIVLCLGESVLLEAKCYPANADAEIKWDIKADNDDEESCVSIETGNQLKAKRINQGNVWVVASAEGIEKKIPVSVKTTEFIHTTDEEGNLTVQDNGEEGQIVIADGIWVGGFNKFDNVYTGGKVKQKINVYYKSKKLTLNKDYTLTYKNNVKPCSAFKTNSPSVTITMKGQYTGKKTLFYEIIKANASQFVIKNDGIGLNYNGKTQKLVPNVYYKGKKLEYTKDYTVEYDPNKLLTNFKGNSTSSTKIDYIITGIRYFEGTLEGSYYITPKKCNISKATVSLKSSVKYYGNETDEQELIEEFKQKLGLKIKFAGETTYSELDPEVYNIEIIIPKTKVGTGKVIISSKDDSFFSGTITKTFKIVAAYNLSTVADINESFDLSRPFYKNAEWNHQVGSGEGERNQLLSLKADGTKLTEGIDYKVKYSGIGKVGIATAKFTGIGAYSGTLIKEYKLVSTYLEPSIEGTESTEGAESTVSYVQGGTKLSFKVFVNEVDPWGESVKTELVKNVDYSVSYLNNKKVGMATAKITFIGNYKKIPPQRKTFEITAGDISQCKVSVSDKKYIVKKNSYKSVPTVYAPNGKKLVEGIDYSKSYEYIYDDMDLTNNPPAGTTVMVRITGINNYAGSHVTGTYKVYNALKMDKLFIYIDDQTYTGKEIRPDFDNEIDNEIHIYTSYSDRKYKRNEIENPGLRIISYKNNIKSGKATVVFGGSFDGTVYGGKKSVTFNIKKRSNGNVAVKGIYLNSTQETLVSKTEKAKLTLTATFKPETPTNKVLIWKSSNTSVAKIVEIDGQKCTIEAQSKGTSIITCTTQDGAKVAKCTVTSSMKTIKSISSGKTKLKLIPGESTMLDVVYEPADAYVGGSGVVYSTSNSNVVTVDNTGKVTAVSSGMATVIGQFNDKSFVCFVEVNDLETISYIDLITDYKATPDDDIDDTEAFNKAIEALKKRDVGQRNLRIPSGKYLVSTIDSKYTDCSINMNGLTDAYIYMEPGVVIYHNADSHPDNMRGVITLDRAKNVIIEGGSIDCNRDSSDLDENYFGIMVARSSDIQIKGVKVLNSSGDGIYFGKPNETENINRNILINDCEIFDCKRNNIALVNVENIVLDNCKIHGLKGYSGGSGYDVGTGLDIEPNDREAVKNVLITNCTFWDNRSDFGIHCHYKTASCTQTNNITIDGCSFDKLVYIQCGKNVVFKNTVKKPHRYCDDRKGYITIFPD